jgi:hypothetical protein
MVAGAALMVTGGFLLIGADLKALAAMGIGLGAALLGLSVGSFINYLVGLKHPEIKHAQNIDLKDERNIIIRDKTGARTNSVHVWLLFAVTLAFVLLDVELYITLAMAGLMLANGIVHAAYAHYYNKRL